MSGWPLSPSRAARRTPRGTRLAVLVAASAVALSGVIVGVAPTAATAATAPAHVRTIGGPGHAEMYPSGLDVGPDGTLYVADTGNDQIAAYDRSGRQLWRVGFRGPNYMALGRFNNPRDLAVLGGRIYVADLANNRVQVLDAGTGSAITSWDHRFPSIIGISAGVDAAGSPIVLASDDRAQEIRIFRPDGTWVRSVGSGPESGTCPTQPCAPGVLNGPRDAATDRSGNIYVADYANDRMAKFAPDGTFLKNWGVKGSAAGQFGRPYGVAVGGDGRVYVADSNNGRIQKFTTDGGYLGSYGSQVAGELPANGAGSKATGRWTRRAATSVTTTTAARAKRLAPAQRSTRHATPRLAAPSPARDAIKSPGPRVPGEFFGLRRVAVGPGPTPEVFGADLWDFRIERFAQNGAHTRTYGNVKPAAGGFNEAYGVAVDATSTFVMDTNNQRVQRFDETGSYELQWGQRGFGDGNPGFNWARDLTISAASDSVWVADTKNNRLQEFSRGGIATGRAMGRFGTTAGPGILWWPHAVQSYGGLLLVANTKLNRVELWDPARPATLPTGQTVTGSQVWSSSGPADLPFSNPKDVTVVGDVVYVADSLNGRIVRLSAIDGSVIDSFGSTVLHRVEGVAVEPNGTVWVADTSHNRLVQFAADGSLLQAVGGPGTAHGRFNNPTHLEVRVAGATVELLVVDAWNDRIEVFRLGQ